MSIKEISVPLLMELEEKQIMFGSKIVPNLTVDKQMNTQSTQTTPTDITKAMRSIAINTENPLRDLTENANAWVPQTLKYYGKVDDEYAVRKILGILNKLTPANYDKLKESVSYLPIDSMKTIEKVSALIVEKTINELTFAPTYYRFCKYLFSPAGFNNIMFRGMLINRLEEEFFVNVNNAETKVVKLKPLMDELAAATESKKKQQIKFKLDYEEYQFRRRALGIINFISGLYKLGSLTENIICCCIESLLDQKCEDKLEFMCKLLAATGHQLETASLKPLRIEQRLDAIFIQMQHLIHKKKQGTIPKISNRVRFMMQDIIDLRDQNWNQKQNAGRHGGANKQLNCC